MKGWSVAIGLLSLSGAVAAAVFAGMHAQANAENATNALVLAERAAPAASRSAPTVPPPAAPSAPSAPRAAAPLATPPTANAVAAAAPRVSFRKTTTENGAPVYVPDGCHGAYDVVMHFHGAHPYVRALVEKANLNAVVAVFNAGNGAEKYAQAFGAGGSLSSLLHQIEVAAAPLCAGADAHAGRVGLMAWSAGYAAVEKLLSREEDRERIDAALLADGLHAGFANVWKRQFAPNALEPFRNFGELAKQGQKLFAITHSSIMTDGYGSTTECSRLLLKALNVPCDEELVSGKSGDFSIEGFTGADAPAHIVQFRQMDTTLLSKLRERWSH